MSREDVVVVSLRLLALYVALSLVFGIPDVVQGLSLSLAVTDVVIIASGLVLLSLLCVVLWCFPVLFAGVFSAGLISIRGAVRPSQSEWEVPGIKLVGLWFFIQSSGDFTYWGLLFVGEWPEIMQRGFLRSDVFLLVGVALLKLIVSIGTIFWARTLSGWIRTVAR